MLILCFPFFLFLNVVPVVCRAVVVVLVVVVRGLVCSIILKQLPPSLLQMLGY